MVIDYLKMVSSWLKTAWLILGILLIFGAVASLVWVPFNSTWSSRDLFLIVFSSIAGLASFVFLVRKLYHFLMAFLQIVYS